MRSLALPDSRRCSSGKRRRTIAAAVAALTEEWFTRPDWLLRPVLVARRRGEARGSRMSARAMASCGRSRTGIWKGKLLVRRSLRFPGEWRSHDQDRIKHSVLVRRRARRTTQPCRRSSSSNGHPGRCLRLARTCRPRHAHEPTTRIAWFRAAAELGHGHAQMMLGRYLSSGAAGDQDDEDARLWLERAVAQGIAEAEPDLAALRAPARGSLPVAEQSQRA